MGDWLFSDIEKKFGAVFFDKDRPFVLEDRGNHSPVYRSVKCFNQFAGCKNSSFYIDPKREDGKVYGDCSLCNGTVKSYENCLNFNPLAIKIDDMRGQEEPFMWRNLIPLTIGGKNLWEYESRKTIVTEKEKKREAA